MIQSKKIQGTDIKARYRNKELKEPEGPGGSIPNDARGLRGRAPPRGEDGAACEGALDDERGDDGAAYEGALDDERGEDDLRPTARTRDARSSGPARTRDARRRGPARMRKETFPVVRRRSATARLGSGETTWGELGSCGGASEGRGQVRGGIQDNLCGPETGRRRADFELGYQILFGTQGNILC